MNSRYSLGRAALARRRVWWSRQARVERENTLWTWTTILVLWGAIVLMFCSKFFHPEGIL